MNRYLGHIHKWVHSLTQCWTYWRFGGSRCFRDRTVTGACSWASMTCSTKTIRVHKPRVMQHYLWWWAAKQTEMNFFFFFSLACGMSGSKNDRSQSADLVTATGDTEWGSAVYSASCQIIYWLWNSDTKLTNDLYVHYFQFWRYFGYFCIIVWFMYFISSAVLLKRFVGLIKCCYAF